MRIGGFQPFSLSDFPGRPACILFAQGCNFRCPFCHNPALVGRTGGESLDEAALLCKIADRAGRLEGVVISGGEPCIQPGLPALCARIKELGLSVKLDTNGSKPHVLAHLIQASLVDYIAMDIKAPDQKLSALTGRSIDPASLRASIDRIVQSGIDHEFRSTLMTPHLTPDDVLSMAAPLQRANRYVLQSFVPDTPLDPRFRSARPFSSETVHLLRETLRNRGIACTIR